METNVNSGDCFGKDQAVCPHETREHAAVFVFADRSGMFQQAGKGGWT
jgi:hypothetical protein